MPELPEVETMVRGIRGHVTERTIRDVVRCPNECKPNPLSPAFKLFRKRLIGPQFSGVKRIGKRVLLTLSDDSNLVIEPRMTGLVLLSDPPDVEHLRLRWDFEGPGNYHSFWFWDRRGLGTIRLFSASQFQELLESGKLGPDALEMTPTRWKEQLGHLKREIKTALLDQKVVAGIGNLYASEILHLAAISPSAIASSLSPQMIGRLADASQTVLSTAIEHEGSTLGDGTYRTALNKSGGYQNLHRVYMKAGKPCPTCVSGKIMRIVQAQRSTFFCPICQKSPKKVGSKS